MTKTEINYKGRGISDIYTLALIGADFATEKNENGVTVVNSLKKHLYIKTVLLARLLTALDIPEDKVMSIEQYNNNNVAIADLKGNGKNRLKADFDMFVDMIEDEINNVIACNNDIENRINDSIKTNITPEKIEELIKQKDELIKELNKK